MRALEMSDAQLGNIARAARERTLAEHTAEHRVAELEQALDNALRAPEPNRLIKA